MVAIASDRRSVELEPLGRHIDTDQLDMLFSPAFMPNADTSVSVTFDYEGYTVEVDPDGTVRLLAE